jgi:class 3 adenylate cyclase
MSEPPSGTVTFLFSDIVGSTRLLKALRDDCAEVLATHHRLVRAAIAEGDGYEVDTAGDAFFAAFGQAGQAVRSAAGIQRALAEQPWPAGSPVRVRIGIHTGQASWSGESYTGLAVHRAARICSAASGGQVLVSQATATISADEEAEEEFALTDLGERQLKDLDRPVRLYQVAVPGLASPGDARIPPAPASARGGLQGFPASLTSYIGRAEVSEVAARLAAATGHFAEAVTLWGPSMPSPQTTCSRIRRTTFRAGPPWSLRSGRPWDRRKLRRPRNAAGR